MQYQRSFVNLKASVHNESYTNRALPGSNGVPHTGLDRDDCRVNNGLARMRAWITHIPETMMHLPELHD